MIYVLLTLAYGIAWALLVGLAAWLVRRSVPPVEPFPYIQPSRRSDET